MPTTAQMHIDDVNNELLRQTLANQAALQQAKMQAAAQQYLADKQYAATDLTSGRALEGNKYNADANLAGIDKQQTGQNYRTDAEQRGSIDRTRMMVEPQKMAQELEKQKYLNSMDYLKAAMVREAMGQQIPPMAGDAGTPVAPSSGGSQPAGMTFNEYAAKNGLTLPKGGAPAGKYDMTGFNKDVAGIAANIDAVRGTSPAMGPDDLPVATAWTPGASIMGADGVRRQVAFPPSALPKPMEKTTPGADLPIDGNPAKPAVAAPPVAAAPAAAGGSATGQPDFKLLERLGVIQRSPEDVRRDELGNILTQYMLRTVMTDPDPSKRQVAADQLKQQGIDIPLGAFGPTDTSSLLTAKDIAPLVDEFRKVAANYAKANYGRGYSTRMIPAAEYGGRAPSETEVASALDALRVKLSQRMPPDQAAAILRQLATKSLMEPTPEGGFTIPGLTATLGSEPTDTLYRKKAAELLSRLTQGG